MSLTSLFRPFSPGLLSLAAAASLAGAGCDGSAETAEPMSVLPERPDGQPQGTRLASLTVEPDHQVDFYEAQPGLTYIAEKARIGQALVLTEQMRGRPLADVYRALAPAGIQVPQALFAADARQPTQESVPAVTKEPPAPPAAQPHFYTAAENDWFRNTYCARPMQRCAFGSGRTWLQTERPENETFSVAMAGAEGRSDTYFANYWWYCGAGGCFWSRIASISLRPGYWGSLIARTNNCRIPLYFATGAWGEANGLSEERIQIIDCGPILDPR